VKYQDVVSSIQLEEADGCDAVSSCQEDRVDTHQNAPMTPAGRLRMVKAVVAGEPIRAAAQRCGVDRKSIRKWVLRYRAEGKDGLRDRSSRPHHSPRAIAREGMANALRPITGMDAKQFEAFGRRMQLTADAQRECHMLDEAIPSAERDEKQVSAANLQAAQQRLFGLRTRYRALRC
jgi:transposase